MIIAEKADLDKGCYLFELLFRVFMHFSKIFNPICLLGLGLGSVILDFWISQKFQEGAKIERKVIEPNKETLI